MSNSECISRADELHERAMALVDQALMDKAGGRQAQHEAKMREAFRFERQAAQIVAMSDLEPSRSVLLRSAASLALECGEVLEARRLASVALSGEPHAEIAAELRDVLVQVTGDPEIDRGRILFDSYQPSVQRLFVEHGLPRDEARRLARITFQMVLRETESPGLEDFMRMADRLAVNDKRSRWIRSSLRLVQTPRVEEHEEMRSGDPQLGHLTGALDDLPNRMRRCFILRQRGHGYPVIARVLRTSTEGAERLWNQALERLAEVGGIDQVETDEQSSEGKPKTVQADRRG